ncbi:MAG: hypothetical protein Fur0043_06270 [Anaerolineales bacterium]
MTPQPAKTHLIAASLVVFMLILACGLPAASTPAADPNAFNTMVAQIAQAAMTQTAAARPPTNVPPPPGPGPASPTPTVPLTDETLIKQSLLAKLGWTESEMEFNLGQNTGQIARGSVKKANEMQGAAWFAGKDAAGKWVIAYVGQGVPNCADIQPFNFPIDWISHCMDASGNAVERASAQAAPTEGTLPDVYAPNPLGPLFSSMYISAGMCYDMDVLFHTTDASCDVFLDSTGLLRPRNGGLFSGYATLTPPSLNQCKAAQLSADPIAPNSDLYMCFKTNLGKYGFFVARQIDMNGIVFDAYVFP